MRKCPICGLETESVFCPVCGWEHRVFPAVVPESVRQMEEEREAVAKKVLKENVLQQENLRKELFSLKQALDDANSKLQAAQAELEKNKSDVSYAYLVQSYNGVLQNVYPIHEGDNVFGSSVSYEPGYRQVLEGALTVRNFIIRATLQVNPRGRKKASYAIVPCEGNVAVASPMNMVAREQPLPLLEKIYAGGLMFQLLDDVYT